MEKWMNIISESISSPYIEDEGCECNSYDCETCFPSSEATMNESVINESSFDDDMGPIQTGSASDDVSDLIAQIVYTQDVGMSSSSTKYNEDTLMRMKSDAVKRIHAKVMGDLLETSSGGIAMGGEYNKVANADEGIYEDVYTDHGYANRKEYLLSLCDEYGVPEDIVFATASLLGRTEDFDGLVTMIQDYADMYMDEAVDPNDSQTMDMFSGDSYSIDSEIAAYLINGDASGINDADQRKADRLTRSLGAGHWEMGEESYDSNCDLTGFSNRCVEMLFVPAGNEHKRMRDLAGI